MAWSMHDGRDYDEVRSRWNHPPVTTTAAHVAAPTASEALARRHGDAPDTPNGR